MRTLQDRQLSDPLSQSTSLRKKLQMTMLKAAARSDKQAQVLTHSSGSLPIELSFESNNSSCFPITIEFYDFAKKSLNVNLQTLVLSVLMIPMNILYVYIYVTGESCETQLPRPPGKPFYWPIAYYLTMVAYLGFWIITFRKLSM